MELNRTNRQSVRFTESLIRTLRKYDHELLTEGMRNETVAELHDRVDNEDFSDFTDAWWDYSGSTQRMDRRGMVSARATEYLTRRESQPSSPGSLNPYQYRCLKSASTTGSEHRSTGTGYL